MQLFCGLFQIVANLQNFSNMFIEKNPHMRGPTRFKHVLFKGSTVLSATELTTLKMAKMVNFRYILPHTKKKDA